MSAGRIRAAASVLLLLACSVAWSGQTDPSGSIEVEIRDGLLTLVVRNAHLSDVVQAIGKEAGFETVVKGEIDEVINRTMEKMPLNRALRYLLDGVTTATFFAPSESKPRARRIVEVRLYGGARRSSPVGRPTEVQEPQSGPEPLLPPGKHDARELRALAESGLTPKTQEKLLEMFQ